jgi:hypothetical protein
MPGRIAAVDISLILAAAAPIVVIAAMLIAQRGRADGSFERIVRCRSGHLFTTTVIPGASLKAVRLGRVRFQRCPIGRHWTLVQRVDVSTLTAEEIAAARSAHDVRVP